jgi:hypothetical protein
VKGKIRYLSPPEDLRTVRCGASLFVSKCALGEPNFVAWDPDGRSLLVTFGAFKDQYSKILRVHIGCRTPAPTQHPTSAPTSAPTGSPTPTSAPTSAPAFSTWADMGAPDIRANGHDSGHSVAGAGNMGEMDGDCDSGDNCKGGLRRGNPAVD